MSAKYAKINGKFFINCDDVTSVIRKVRELFLDENTRDLDLPSDYVEGFSDGLNAVAKALDLVVSITEMENE